MTCKMRPDPKRPMTVSLTDGYYNVDETLRDLREKIVETFDALIQENLHSLRNMALDAAAEAIEGACKNADICVNPDGSLVANLWLGGEDPASWRSSLEEVVADAIHWWDAPPFETDDLPRLRDQLRALADRIDERLADVAGESLPPRRDAVEPLHAALRLGAAMRAAQRAYFADRSRDNLIASKQAEAAFDVAAKALMEAPQG